MAGKDFPKDIFTEPRDVDPDTLANLGPLGPMAGVWEGKRGLDVPPTADGPSPDGGGDDHSPEVTLGTKSFCRTRKRQPMAPIRAITAAIDRRWLNVVAKPSW